MASVLVAMSGGVDSAVAAALLKQKGYDVIGVTMRLVAQGGGEYSLNRSCCTLDDALDARRVAHALDIPHYIINLEAEFRARVVDYFADEYLKGRTPNPCVACNRYIKFDALMKKADALGIEYVATGHYARIEGTGERLRLLKASDASKDQSYVLYMLQQHQLRRLLLPIGTYHKSQVRAMAEQLGLIVANKPDSQEICFVPHGDYRAFVANYRRQALEPGPIVDTSGQVLGQHPGIAFFTVGQRRGIGVATGSPLYVVDIQPETRTVVVGPAEDLMVRTIELEEVSFVAGTPPDSVFRAAVKLRYRSGELAATVRVLGTSRAEVELDAPARAVAPGQVAVFYHGDEVLGGGIIRSRSSGTYLPV